MRLTFRNCPGARRALLRAAAIAGAIFTTSYAPAAGAVSLDEVVERYRGYLIEDIDRTLAGTRALRGRMKAGDLEGAKRAWIEARVGWERSEVFTSGFGAAHSIPEARRALEAAEDELEAAKAASTELQKQRAAAERKLSFARSGVEQAVADVVKTDAATKALIEEFERARQQLA